MRAGTKLWDSVKCSMDYVETFNYWSVTLDKIGSLFSGYGYDSADAYVNSFIDRLEELTSKMTGYEIVDGIEYGVERAVARVLASYLADIVQNTRKTADKELGITERAISKAMVNQDRQFYKRTGRGILEH